MHRSRRRIASLAALTALVTLVIVAGPVAAGTGSLELLGTSTDDHWAGWTSFSADGTWVAYQSDVDGQVYVDDLATDQTVLVSTADGTTASNQPPFSGSYPEISRDGRFVTFTSLATNLSPADTDIVEDVYLKDLQTGTLTLVSTSSTGQKGNLPSNGPAPVSDDGSVVAFVSRAGNFPPVTALPPGCPEPENTFCLEQEVYVKDLTTGELTLASLGRGDGGDAVVTSPAHLALSADGSRVAFATADVMTADDTDLYYADVYVREVATGATVLVSNADPGVPSMYYVPSMSADGTRLAFQGDVAGHLDVYARDLAAAAPVLVSRNADGDPGNDFSQQARIADDGQTVAFQSRATNLLPEDTDTVDDVYLADLGSGALTLVSQDDAGVKGNNGSEAVATLAGPAVVIATRSTNFDPAVSSPGEFGYFLKRVAATPPPSPDANGDGVLDVLQPAGTAGGAFVDATTAPPTTGSIVDAAGLTVTVADATDPAEGVLVTTGPGSGQATLAACGLTVRLTAASSAVLTCGSVVVRTVSGVATVETDAGAITVAIPAGAAAEVADTATGALVSEVLGGTVEVTALGTTTALAAGSAPREFSSTPPPDANGDGVVDVLQPPGAPAGSFTDTTTSPVTSGSVVAANGLAVAVTDAPDPADGVLVTVSGPSTTTATLSVCGLRLKVAGGGSAVLTCGSVVVEALTGTVVVETDGGFISVAVPAGATAEVSDTAAGATVLGVTGGTVTVTVNGSRTSVPAGSAPRSFNAWVVSAFRDPVDAVPVANVMKAGRAVPLRWHLSDSRGRAVTTLRSVTVTTVALDCSRPVRRDTVEQTFANGGQLQNLGGGNYQLVWKTSASWAASCRSMTLDLGGGIRARAWFAFTR